MAGRPLRPRALSSTGISSSSAARRRPRSACLGRQVVRFTDGVALVLGQRPLAAACPRSVGDVRCGWPRDVEPGRRVRSWVAVRRRTGRARACRVRGRHVPGLHFLGRAGARRPAGRRAIRHRRLGARSPAVLRGIAGSRGIVRDAGRRGPPRHRPLPSWRRWRVGCAPAARAQGGGTPLRGSVPGRLPLPAPRGPPGGPARPGSSPYPRRPRVANRPESPEPLVRRPSTARDGGRPAAGSSREWDPAPFGGAYACGPGSVLRRSAVGPRCRASVPVGGLSSR